MRRRRAVDGRLLQHRDGRERREGGGSALLNRAAATIGAAVEHGEGDIVGRAVCYYLLYFYKDCSPLAPGACGG